MYLSENFINLLIEDAPYSGNPLTDLGLNKNATKTDIMNAYRKKVKKYHHDAGSSPNPEKLRKANEAYKAAMDPLYWVKRKSRKQKEKDIADRVKNAQKHNEQRNEKNKSEDLKRKDAESRRKKQEQYKAKQEAKKNKPNVKDKGNEFIKKIKKYKMSDKTKGKFKKAGIIGAIGTGVAATAGGIVGGIAHKRNVKKRAEYEAEQNQA